MIYNYLLNGICPYLNISLWNVQGCYAILPVVQRLLFNKLYVNNDSVNTSIYNVCVYSQIWGLFMSICKHYLLRKITHISTPLTHGVTYILP